MRFISPECRDDVEEAQCSRCFASSLEEYGRLHGAMRSAVYTIPKGLKQINEHCTSFLFLITYYNSGLLVLRQNKINFNKIYETKINKVFSVQNIISNL